MNIPGANTVIDRDLTMVLACLCIIAPLSFFRDLSKLRFAGILGIVALVYVALVVVIEFGYFAQVNNFNEVSVAKLDINIFTAFSISLFSFLCHTNLVKVYGDLSKRYPSSMYKVIDRSLVMELTFFTIIALFGYLSFLDDTPSLALLRTPPSNIDNDWAMVVG
jgi:amino acid permease